MLKFKNKKLLISECASLLVERKLFEETKDEFGLVFFGTEGTKNPLSYENVEISKRGFCRADWDTVKYLREHIVGTEVEGDWVDGLVVALDFLRRESEGKKYTTLKIVLFSDLGCPANADQMDDIINGIKLLDNVDLTHIGPEWKDEDEEDEPNGMNGNNDEPKPGTSRGEAEKPRYTAKPRTKTQEINENVINQIIHQTEGTACSLGNMQ
ncbi:X-ray repair cross-complementing protein 5 [Eurytemora carolleeae]|uniref:X-ray repair cross-complementing protein 5 n=1 Tax=Eurytemora carolleeae TaxID=1294199 RepID=UPI000C7711A4|nr:X-ray repair cross-complementing protein 5 [Eurytemora carolleeae]|eukprot:XP_023334987.1 X-ray repair cross-complementing protein 5-like [Eurytemora affinis]